MKEKTAADNWFEALKGKPKEIIKWAKREIKEYQKLIKLIEEDQEDI